MGKLICPGQVISPMWLGAQRVYGRCQCASSFSLFLGIGSSGSSSICCQPEPSSPLPAVTFPSIQLPLICQGPSSGHAHLPKFSTYQTVGYFPFRFSSLFSRRFVRSRCTVWPAAGQADPRQRSLFTRCVFAFDFAGSDVESQLRPTVDAARTRRIFAPKLERSGRTLRREVEAQKKLPPSVCLLPNNAFAGRAVTPASCRFAAAVAANKQLKKSDSQRNAPWSSIRQSAYAALVSSAVIASMGRFAARSTSLPQLLLLLISVDRRLLGGAADDGSLRVPYDELLRNASRFEMTGVTDFKALLFDGARSQIIVGARDVVFRIDQDTMVTLERLDLPASSANIDNCQMKGRPAELCRNYIRVLAAEPNGQQVLVCGTDAFKPSCSVRQMDDLRKATALSNEAVGFVPYDPEYNFTYVVDSDGQFFAGGPIDFTGDDYAIIRPRPSDALLRTRRPGRMLLYDPTFVAAYEIGEFIYFFLYETAMEDMAFQQHERLSWTVARDAYSRVARVCKNDPGPPKSTGDIWFTTFSKARLVCVTSGGQLFDNVQSVDFVREEGLFYAVFTASKRHIMGSAICHYKLADIEEAFHGPALIRGEGATCWLFRQNSEGDNVCRRRAIHNSSGYDRFSTEKYMMQKAILPLPNRSLRDVQSDRYVKIVVDAVRVKNVGTVHVLFVLEANGTLNKYSHLPKEKELCLLETIELRKAGDSVRIFDMQMNPEKKALFFTMDKRLLRVPLERCARYGSEARCIGAKDPYCGWNKATRQCTGVRAARTGDPNWKQAIDGCPDMRFAVHGQYGPWSAWTVCSLNPTLGENCLCRVRSCDNPEPKFGGSPCNGPKIEVSNCTVHGRWTVWGIWSPCGTTCGISLRSRYRYCSNPAPAYGGHWCTGSDVESEYCDVPACPLPTPPRQNGQWSAWSQWRPCSKKCDGGFRKRTRSCDNPPPMNGGDDCVGSAQEFESCNNHQCEEIYRVSDWTQWVKIDETSTGGLLHQRYRFSCSARLPNPSDLIAKPITVEEKVCAPWKSDCAELSVSATSSKSQWSLWSEWSACTKVCGSGTQSRQRLCMSTNLEETGPPRCIGPTKETRLCNVKPCTGTHLDFNTLPRDPTSSWSCWSDFTECSASCGHATKQRWRVCNGAQQCVGESQQTVACQLVDCPLSDEASNNVWSVWSRCNELNLRTRIQLCNNMEACSDQPDFEIQRCGLGSDQVELVNALHIRQENHDQTALLIVSIIGSIIIVVLLVLLLVCCAKVFPGVLCCRWANKRRGGVPPPTPSTKLNIYTPPPSLRNGRSQTPNIIMNPLGRFSAKEEFEGLTEEETALTLKRNMLTSLNTKDYM
uniref:Sema domain-containing protein n=1 Tax=Trichuris muris TaxID=70415 RepID=A0A5S6QKT5_TRIMR